MPVLDGLLQRKIESISLSQAVVMPDGSRIGPRAAAITLRWRELLALPIFGVHSAADALSSARGF